MLDVASVHGADVLKEPVSLPLTFVVGSRRCIVSSWLWSLVVTSVDHEREVDVADVLVPVSDAEMSPDLT